ncbi:nickel pincer cofactor biosynthesis protein LarB [Thermodesulforhabdus norvegica]|uniref:PurE domain-containing protein n=1 Tax=Thermodesulforhabdus norvegica TaxID=39841 RepID=A0A1I4RCX7_9BACT|nr:nickel pincer cofactor biosynthesis protein LarB [Thermodesulforhabdus norvegica]SFM50057.1 hypothetical protein SAMN05660836_00549 [Thermodesulforhabdus norvegica]
MERLRRLLEEYRKGNVGIDEVMSFLKELPYENLSFARIDHHRALRRGFPEVIYGEGKKAEHLRAIVESMARRGSNVLITRLDRQNAEILNHAFPEARYHADARVWILQNSEIPSIPNGYIAVLTGGTLDIPVAEEAALTAELMGSQVRRFYDVGVAGLHRLLDIREEVCGASAWVVVAGMEGALPSVVAGLVEGPVVAVPTSVGYGSHFNGIAPLLAMLTTCVPGIVVVNIDNGFGGGYVASVIHRRIALGRGWEDGERRFQTRWERSRSDLEARSCQRSSEDEGTATSEETPR